MQKRVQLISLIEKATLFMKFSVFVFSIICVTIMDLKASDANAQAVLDKRITLNIKQRPLNDVFEEISALAKVSFTYSGNSVNTDNKISIAVKNAKISYILNKILAPLSISYVVIDEKIVIRSSTNQPKALPETITKTEDNKDPVYSSEINITGIIKNAKGEVLKGATVSVKGSSQKTTTDDKGEFELKGVKDGATLIISMIGYKTIEVKAKQNLSIELLDQVSVLDEVVVTGYQNIDKKKFTGAAVTLKADSIKIDGVTDLSRMLEGRAAGVSIQNVSGTFGAAPKVRIRGATSITGENKPLWVIDGVVLEDIVNISNDQLSNGDPSTMLGSAVAGLNVNDIETFDILKDAAAAALYGARAMNGVIVITTKKGKIGKPVVSYTGNFGVQIKPSYANYDIMNAADQMSVYAEIERKGYLRYSDLVNARNSGVYGKLAKLLQYPDDNGNFAVLNTAEARQAWLMQYANANTNWFNILFKNSLTQEHTLSISTGTDKHQSYFSASFYNDEGWTIADNVKRYTVNARNNYVITNKLSFGFLANGSVRQQRAPGTEDRKSNPVEGSYSRDFDINPFSYALNTSRVLTAYDKKGNLEYFTRDFAPFNIINEIQNNYLKLSVVDVKLQANLSYKITPSINYEFVGALRYAKTAEEHQVLESSNEANAYRAAGTSIIKEANPFLYRDPTDPSTLPVTVLPYGGFYKTKDRQLLNYTFRNVFTFNKSFSGKDHVISALVGQEVKSADRQLANNIGIGYQYNNGGIPYIDYRFIKKMTENNEPYYGLSTERDRFIAFFANASYTYKSRYTFSGTVREDGSNRLGSSPQARWLPTWTVSGVWNVDRENFMQNVRAISHLMLKSSYGLNASIGDATNTTAILRTEITNRHYLTDQQTAISIKNLENADLTWEKKYELNIGTDIGLFNERLGLVFDWYKRSSFDLIHTFKTSGIGGEIYKAANYADMKSHGVDIAITGKIITKKNWSWTASLVFGYNITKITNAKNQPMIFDLVKQEGGTKEGYVQRGLYSVQNAGLEPNAKFSGVPLFIDQNGVADTTVYAQSTNTSFLKYEGSVDPLYTGGFNHTIRYKNFTLSALFTYQAGNKIRLTPAYSVNYSDLSALPGEFRRRYTLPGDETLTNIPSVAMLFVNNDLVNNTQYPYNTYNYSGDRVADGGFVRLKVVSLQYALPNSFASRIGMKTASLTVVGNNLWLIYSDPRLHGQDPEFFNTGGVALPINRQVTFSLKLGL
ncbi:MAG: SusC/RagA family TonB-linked outer membrane protein [Sphingobacteriia bacterium]|nr:SusC/RagA family TonB-linked outer membrane protein [Sphingobacteriia bacterium]